MNGDVKRIVEGIPVYLKTWTETIIKATKRSTESNLWGTTVTNLRQIPDLMDQVEGGITAGNPKVQEAFFLMQQKSLVSYLHIQEMIDRKILEKKDVNPILNLLYIILTGWDWDTLKGAKTIGSIPQESHQFWKGFQNVHREICGVVEITVKELNKHFI